jgi:predicted acylesterase/phospholipase RssA
MPSYSIEVLAIHKDLLQPLRRAIESLNRVQGEFYFWSAPDEGQQNAFLQRREQYITTELFKWLIQYRAQAKGGERYTMLLVDGPLSSSKWLNLFGSHKRDEGLVVFTTHGCTQFVKDIVRFVRYYLVRYSLSFVAPEIRSHPTRDPLKGCFFDRKNEKADILLSLQSGNICKSCQDQLAPQLTPAINTAIYQMIKVVTNETPYALVMKGGGVKGLAFAGAVSELGNYYTFDTFAGVSAGAIAAILFAAGYLPERLAAELRKKDFRAFRDASLFTAVINLCCRRGLYPGHNLKEWLNNLLSAQLNEVYGEVRMEDLPQHTIIYASSREVGTIVFDSKGTKKKSPAAFAARCSMSIPYYFIPQSVDDRRTYDGGLRNNFPLKLFMESYKSKPVIALYLKPLKSMSQPSRWVALDIFNIWIEGEEEETVRRYHDSVVVIDTYPVKTTAFNLSPKEKDFLFCAGKAAALQFLFKQEFDDGPKEEMVRDAERQASDLQKQVCKLRRRPPPTSN